MLLAKEPIYLWSSIVRANLSINNLIKYIVLFYKAPNASLIGIVLLYSTIGPRSTGLYTSVSSYVGVWTVKKL